jgi:hypothetical protein
MENLGLRDEKGCALKHETFENNEGVLSTQSSTQFYFKTMARKKKNIGSSRSKHAILHSTFRRRKTLVRKEE